MIAEMDKLTPSQPEPSSPAASDLSPTAPPDLLPDVANSNSECVVCMEREVGPEYTEQHLELILLQQ